MGQQGLPELRALVKHGAQLLGWQLQDDLEALGLGALAALDEALPHFGVLPHLDGAGRKGASGGVQVATLGTGRTVPRWGLAGAQTPAVKQISFGLHTALTSSQRT